MKIKLEISMPAAPARPHVRPCPVCFEEHDEDDECNMGVRQHGPIPEVHMEPTEYVDKVLKGKQPARKGVFRRKNV